MSLTLGVAFVVAHRVYDLRGPAVQQSVAAPLTDAQSRQQVLETARQFVSAGEFRAANGTYLLATCTADEQPPYKGTADLNFELPTIAETPAYFRKIARAMKARGWREGLPPGHHPGGFTLAKDGVVAVYYRHPDVPRRGVLEIDGECRNVTDHKSDITGFIDITGQLYG